ncbi:hypothetical protein TCAL_17184 [Tigriopus californicus]|uniref:Glycosyl transferase 64 domain-containing protein n=1 Tax=Tigriopus californicus TaxID=6832 RepID=A0A553N8D5_TIGCA|nr:hypothetical protein TCAL_17184 [Tigriopus californicus]
MPQKIRDDVDRYLNCDDIFMTGFIADFMVMAPVKFSKKIEVTSIKCDKAYFKPTNGAIALVLKVSSRDFCDSEVGILMTAVRLFLYLKIYCADN